MPAHGVFRNGYLFQFRYSPLGLPVTNLIPVGFPWRPGVHGVPAQLYALDTDEAAWVPVPWKPDLWWLRLLLVADDVTAGTRWEDAGRLDRLERALAWWIATTPPVERATFGIHPDPWSVVKQLRAVDRALARDLNRVLALLSRVAPKVLTAIPNPRGTPSSRLLSPLYAGHALRRVLTALSGGVAYQYPAWAVDRGMRERFGARLDEVRAPLHNRERLVVPGVAPPSLESAIVTRFPLVCELAWGANILLATVAEDHLWRSALHHLLAMCMRIPIIVLDGPPGSRRQWLRTHVTSRHPCWVLCRDVASAVHWREVTGEAVGVMSSWSDDTARRSMWVYVDGAHDLPGNDFVSLLERLAAATPTGVVLAGDACAPPHLPAGHPITLWRAWVASLSHVIDKHVVVDAVIHCGLRYVPLLDTSPTKTPTLVRAPPSTRALARWVTSAASELLQCRPMVLTLCPRDGPVLARWSPVVVGGGRPPPPLRTARGHPLRLRDGSVLHAGDEVCCVRKGPLEPGSVHRAVAVVDHQTLRLTTTGTTTDLPLSAVSDCLGTPRCAVIRDRYDAYYDDQPVVVLLGSADLLHRADIRYLCYQLGNAVTVVVAGGSGEIPPPTPGSSPCHAPIWDELFAHLLHK